MVSLLSWAARRGLTVRNLGSASSPVRQIIYEPAGETVRRFHESNAFVRALMGPVGAGKSVACGMELLRRAGEQQPAPDGIRYSRFAIIRSTYPELQTTTLRTFQQWVPITLGKHRAQPPISFHMQAEGIDAEFIFLALEREEDVRKLLSLELTGAWINETREVPRAVVDMLTTRVGRYPQTSQGGPTWSGVILDTNPPDTESWFYKLFEVDRPEGYEIFKQPSGLSAEAENISHLPKGYYERLAAGKDEDFVNVYVHGEYGFVQEGRPVYPSWRDSTHVAQEPINPVANLPLLIGVDFGLTPAAIIAQQLADGRWLILDEFCADDAGVARFGNALTRHVAQTFPHHKVVAVYCDPAGNQRAQTDERTAMDVLREATGWKVRPAPSNDLTMRLEIVRNALGRMIDGKPGILISPTCPILRKGFSGGYSFRKIRKGITGADYDERPAKNQYSHPHDALQYVLSGGGGEADLFLSRQRAGDRPRFAEGIDYDLFLEAP